MKATKALEGQTVVTVNRYTGTVRELQITKVSASGNKVTVARPDYRTLKAEFYYQPSLDMYAHEYSSESFTI